MREREVKMAQARERANELEAKTTELEDQVLRAYQKLRSDQKTAPQPMIPPPHGSRYQSGCVTPPQAIHVVSTHCNRILTLWHIHSTPQSSRTTA
jgi:hypothetical protein